MIHLLSEPGRAMLDELVSRTPLIAFDFDGTLAPVVDEPARACIRSETRALLCAVARRWRCAVISGRALADLQTRVEGIDFAYLVGNHGAEWPDTDDQAACTMVRSWGAQLGAALGGLPGVTIEEKGLSLSIHLRVAAQESARAMRLASGLTGARAFAGRNVINVVPASLGNKGDALQRLATMMGVSAVMYLGDDTTDEDAFSAAGLPFYVPVRVGHSSESKATLYLQDQPEVDVLLGLLGTIGDSTAQLR